MRRCYLFFHGPKGTTAPVAMGSLDVETLIEAIAVLQRAPDMPADRELAGHWCCTFTERTAPAGDAADEDDTPAHPPSCQYRFRLSATGKISAASIVQ